MNRLVVYSYLTRYKNQEPNSGIEVPVSNFVIIWLGLFPARRQILWRRSWRVPCAVSRVSCVVSLSCPRESLTEFSVLMSFLVIISWKAGDWWMGKGCFIWKTGFRLLRALSDHCTQNSWPTCVVGQVFSCWSNVSRLRFDQHVGQLTTLKLKKRKTKNLGALITIDEPWWTVNFVLPKMLTVSLT